MKKHYKSTKLATPCNTLIICGIRLWMALILIGTFSKVVGGILQPEEEISRELHVDVFLEGLYDKVQGRMRKAHDFLNGEPTAVFEGDIADMVVISLHELADYSLVAWGSLERYSATVPLNRDGRASLILPKDFSGKSIDGTYWLSVNHRNHLEVVYHIPIEIMGEGPFLYDLIRGDGPDEGNSVFGNNLQYVGLSDIHDQSSHTWAMYVGDINGAGTINIIDRSSFMSPLSLGKRGYVLEDLNGDGVVNIEDRSLLEKNIRKSLFFVAPRIY